MRPLVLCAALAFSTATLIGQTPAPEAKQPMNAAKAARRAEWIKQFDADGDGKLNTEERAKMKAALAAKREAKIARSAKRRARTQAALENTPGPSPSPAAR